MQKNKLPKIIAVVGPTSSGKSDLAVSIAKEYNGEVVSADSRQVYKGMDIGTGKVTKLEMKNVAHHLLDVADPKRRYSVARFKKEAECAVDDIIKRNKLPIVCGGTGFYIQAVVDGIILPEVQPNKTLRNELETQSPSQLHHTLQSLDPRRAKEIDKHNTHRLIRAIEIAQELGSVPVYTKKPRYETLQIGIRTADDVLKERIRTRLLKRMRRGMLAEVTSLHKKGVSWRRLDELGLEYRFLSQYLQGYISKSDMLSQLEIAIWHYAKRQKTWFKRDNRIHWHDLEDIEGVNKRIESFLHS